MDYSEFWDNLADIKIENLSKYDDYFLNNHRSSTIFPIYITIDSATRLEFLAYWLKKHGNNVVIRFTSRDLSGEVLCRKLLSIITYRAISIDAADFFKNSQSGFCGSIEVEVFSKLPPAYTFPAITVSFDSKNSNSLVHSCVRTYNNNEQVSDYAMCLPQTGFDVLISPSSKNYICFFGGNKKNYELNISLTERGKNKAISVPLNNKRYGQTHLLYIEDLITASELKDFKRPRVLIKHNLDDVFPRFYAGIKNQEFVPTLTHTFFDTSDVENNSLVNFRAVNRAPEKYFDSAFMIPVYPGEKFKTSLISYGQNLSFIGDAELRFYSNEGELLFCRRLDTKEIELLCRVSEFDVCNEVVACDFAINKSYSMFLGFVGNEKPFPQRFKLGLNVTKNFSALGSNICFAPLVSNETTLLKPFTRRWFPLGGRQKFVASVHNTDLLIDNPSNATNFLFEFINSSGYIMKRDFELKSNESFFLNIEFDAELKSFFDDKVGWCMVTAETYLVDAYYFSTFGQQIGGDHAY
jgi:hypothetical protein